MFSVILPAYNCEKTIYCALESVLKQTRLDLVDEIIIINDGSYDNTDLIIREYIIEHKTVPFKYVYQENRGVSSTRNRGIRMATGEWIALLDSDDIWMPEKLERQANYIKNDANIVFIGSSYPLVIGFKRYYSGLYKVTAKQLCIRNLPSTPSVVFKREAGLRLGLYDESMRYGEDINFFQKFLMLDSYYVIAEELVELSVGKAYFAQSGLSSNLYKMHMGRVRNTTELHAMRLITKRFMIVMQIFNYIKFARRETINVIHKFSYHNKYKGKNMFSVVIPAYNCSDTIEKSLGSILNQTRLDLIEEIIIVNDGSTDDTEKVINRFIENHNETKFVYISQDNHGVSYARNTGIARANGEWIALLDSDDIWLPKKIERQYELINRFNSGG